MNNQSRYRILAPYASAAGSENPGDNIGEGAYGKVYKAIDTLTNTEVALKKMKIETQVDGISSSTLREITFLRMLNHENVIVLRDVEMQNTGRISLIFDLEDCDLAKLLGQNSEPFPEDVVRCYGAQIMAGLAYCHSVGVMHRDLKPQNILVSRTGRLKLADFGLARQIPHAPRPLTVEVITMWYRAPEVLLGHKYYNPSVDVWSAACIICELSNRRVLFRGFKADIDQIHTVFRLLGTPTPEQWPGIESVPYWRSTFPDWPTRPVGLLVPRMNPQGVDFVSRILRYDTKHRMSASTAMLHPYLAGRANGPTAMARSPRAGAHAMVAQSQAGLSGLMDQFGSAPEHHAEMVVSLFDCGAALASRCSSAVDFQDMDFEPAVPAPILTVARSMTASVTGQQRGAEEESRMMFQPISADDQPQASNANATSSRSSSAMLAPSAVLPRPLSTTSNNSQGITNSAKPIPCAFPLASRPIAAVPIRPAAVAATASSHTAVPSTTSFVPFPAHNEGMAMSLRGSKSANQLHQDLDMECRAVRQSAQQPIRVQVPVMTLSSSKSAPSLSEATIGATQSHVLSTRITEAVLTGPTAAPAGSSNRAPARHVLTRIVTEESAAEILFEPPAAPVRSANRQASASSMASSGENCAVASPAAVARPRCGSNDSATSGMSFMSAALEITNEDSQDGFPVAAAPVQSQTSSSTNIGGTSDKGRFNKRKFGSPALVVPAASKRVRHAAAATAAAIVAAGASAAKPKYARVTPEGGTPGTATVLQSFWAQERKGHSVSVPPTAPTAADAKTAEAPQPTALRRSRRLK